jgi:hypothetical protein
MDALTVFGIVTLTVMLILYALEDRRGTHPRVCGRLAFSPRFTAFYRETWPFGVLEVIWAGVAAWRWRVKTRS